MSLKMRMGNVVKKYFRIFFASAYVVDNVFREFAEGCKNRIVQIQSLYDLPNPITIGSKFLYDHDAILP